MKVSSQLRGVIVPALLFACLEIFTRWNATGSDSIAPPSLALEALCKVLGDGTLVRMTGFTLAAAGGGLAIGFVLALVLGTWLGLSRRAGQWSYLTVEVLRPMPSVALIPLAMLIFGFGIRMEMTVAAFAVFWPMLILIQSSARQVDRRLMEVASALELSTWSLFFKIIFPAMVPRIFLALRQGVAIALIVAVTVEIAANPNGLGYAIMVAQQGLDPALMMAWLIWISILGYAVNGLAALIEKRVAKMMGATS
jgi:ABC-type nitrate/sulfonate/bicarbonate transport system permease component